MKQLISLISLTFLFLGCSQNSELLTQKYNDLELKVITLQDSIALLNQNMAKIEELEKSVEYLESKADLLEENLAFYTDRLENIIDIISKNGQNTQKVKGNTASKTVIKTSLTQTPDQLYAQARGYYIRENYSQAKDKFNEFIREYPNHELKINCLYWLAEIEYDKKNYAEAISKFREISLVSVNPEKAIDSLFKIAVINKKIGEYDLALSQAKAINENFPNYIRISKVKAFIKGLE